MLWLIVLILIVLTLAVLYLLYERRIRKNLAEERKFQEAKKRMVNVENIWFRPDGTWEIMGPHIEYQL